MLRDPDTIVTAPPTTLLAATRPPERGSTHPVLWFALGVGLFTADTILLLILGWMLLHL